ncbi:MAG: alpha-glucosyltransferase [Caulobacteraceae bacterium]|nr:alpha-glucosyltransferase [Caulobacteraceae bacterium]
MPRTASRFGDGSPEVAKLMLALLIALRGTILIYQGEELGLPQASLRRDQLRDPVGDLYWPYAGDRDGCRTPMPWRPDQPNLGFSEGEPWLPAAPEHAELTVAAQDADPDSTLTLARQLIALRKDSAAMSLGDLEMLEASGSTLAFVRRAGGEALACVFNMSGEPAVFEHPALAEADILPTGAGDAEMRGGSLGLSPYAAAFLQLPL